MARGVPGFVRIGAALAGCALVAACTPEASPTQTPAAPPASTLPFSTSPAPSATPAETEIERQQRLDWEAAEGAYRAATAEFDRLAQQGGATEPSAELQQHATGQFVTLAMSNLKLFKARGWRQVGDVSIIGIKRVGGWSTAELQIESCEDNSAWRLLDKAGKDITPSDKKDFVQTLLIRKVSGTWKTAEVRTKQVEDVDDGDCT